MLVGLLAGYLLAGAVLSLSLYLSALYLDYRRRPARRRQQARHSKVTRTWCLILLCPVVNLATPLLLLCHRQWKRWHAGTALRARR